MFFCFVILNLDCMKQQPSLFAEESEKASVIRLAKENLNELRNSRPRFYYKLLTVIAGERAFDGESLNFLQLYAQHCKFLTYEEDVQEEIIEYAKRLLLEIRKHVDESGGGRCFDDFPDLGEAH